MVRFGKSENDIKFDHAIDQLLNKPKETMGIVEKELKKANGSLSILCYRKQTLMMLKLHRWLM